MNPDHSADQWPHKSPGEVDNLDQLRAAAFARTLWPLLILGAVAVVCGAISEFSEGRYASVLTYVVLYGLAVIPGFGKALNYRVRVGILMGVLYALALSELWNFGVASLAGISFISIILFAALFYSRRATLGVLVLFWSTMGVMARLYLSGAIEIRFPVQEASLYAANWLAFTATSTLVAFMLSAMIWLLLNILDRSLTAKENLIQSLRNEVLVRKGAEDEIREREALFRQVIDLVPESIYAKDEFSKFIFVNRRSAELMGTLPELAVGKTQRELTPVPGEADELVHEDHEVLRTGRPILNWEHRYTDADGKVHVEQTTKMPFLYGPDREPAVLGVSIDVTQRKNVEEMLRRSEIHFRSLIENVSDVIHVISGDGIITYTSPAVERVLGYTQQERVGSRALDLVHPADRQHVEAILERGFREHGVVYTAEFRLRHKNDTWVTVEAAGRSVEEDGIRHSVIVYRDISERKQSAAERERLLSAIEQAAETIIITDASGVIQYVNPAFTATSGFAREEVTQGGTRFPDRDWSGSLNVQDVWKMLRRGGTWKGQFTSKNKCGDLYTEETTISPVLDGQGQIQNYVVVRRDMSREKELERQLYQAQKMEAIGQLAGGVAHDFNNLLQGIQGYTELVISNMPEHDRNRDMLDQVAGAANRAAMLTRQLLVFSRRQAMLPVTVDLNDVVAQLMKLVRRLIGEHITLDVIPSPQPGMVYADRGQIEQVILNLCVNARDAMPEGGKVVIETEEVMLDGEYCHTHTWARPGRYMLLSVMDTGVGMEKAVIEHIFEPFFTTKDPGRGTGLGLATVYGIVTQHNGMVQVYSEPGLGSTFKVYLPVVQRRASEVGNKLEEPVRGGTEVILLAEDEELVRSLAQQILQEAGYKVLTAENGVEAFEIYRREAARIDLALLDVVMPKLGGLELLNKIRAVNPAFRALMSSGYNENGLHQGAALGDGLHFIQKPFKPSQLLRKIREVLDA